MLNFIFVALCTWITTFLPSQNVSVPSAKEEVVEVANRKNLSGVPDESITLFSSDMVSNEFLFYNIQAFTDYNEFSTKLGPAYNDNVTVQIDDFGKNLGYFSIANQNGFNIDNNSVNYWINRIMFIKRLDATYSDSSGVLYKFAYSFEFYNSSDILRCKIDYYLYTYRSIYIPPLISFDSFYLGQMDAADFNISNIIYYENKTKAQTESSFSTMCPFSTYYLPYYFDRFVEEVDYNDGYNAGFNAGYDSGVDYGEQHPNQTLVDEIYDRGYAYGFSEGLNSDDVLSTIFTGILDVSFIPVNVFIQMFDYEILGVNIAGLISGLLTVALLLILIRFITGRHV